MYNRIVNVLSGLFNLLFGLGAFLGPLLSPNFKNLLGYRGFTDIFALITIIGFAIFLALSMMPLSSNLKNHFIRERSNSSGINQSPDGFINDFDKETQVGEPLISK